MSATSDIESSLDLLCAKYAAAAAAAGPTYSIDGQSVNRMEYLAGLAQAISETRNMLAALQGPVEVETQGMI